MIVLHALGQCLIRTAITTITPRADMCFALGSYLTRERGNRVPRRRIEKLFWPRMHPADASHSLSELIHKLRGKGVAIHRDEAACIWLPREAAAIDVETLSSEPAASIAARDLSILPGYEPRASAAFNDWVDEWRAQMRLRVLGDVIAAIEEPVSAGDWQLSLKLADQALKIDPDNETALLARAHAAAGLTRRDSASSSGARRTTSSHPDTARVREPFRSAAWTARRVDAETGDTAFVGRDDTMERLLAHAMPSLSGAVRSTYISGQAGVGKSRVVRELSAWMRANGAAVCITSCGKHDGHRPLSAFIHSVPYLQRLPGAAGCSPDALAYLESITQLPSTSEPTSARNDSLYRSEAIRMSVIDLVNAITDEQPLLFVLEDVHWIDPASWSLLRALVANTEQSVFIVCTSRVRWQHSSWGEPDTFALEELLPLGHDSAVAHMRNRVAIHHRGAEEAFVEWCVETSGGNPYFIEELVNYWIATGEQYSAPPSLVALVEARLACLTPDALRVIQAAAILGKNSNLELLQRVLEFPTHVLFSSIEELGEAGLLAHALSTKESPSAPVLCRHDIVIHAATRGLSTHGRALLHHAAAQSIESAAGNHSAELLWDCADHWRAAGQIERSVHAAMACARHLHEMGLVHDAVKSCESALALCYDDASRAAVLRTMAQSQYSARDWSAFCQTVAAVRSLDGACLGTTLVHDDLELCELSAQRSLHRDWDGALKRTLLCVQSPAADASHRVRAAIIALKIANNVGRGDIMDLVYDEARMLMNDDGVELSHRLMCEMIYQAARGDPAISGKTAHDLLALARQKLSAHHRLGTLIDCAGALRRSGAINAVEVFEELFNTAIQIGCFGHASDACQRLIETHLDTGDMDLAVKWVIRYRRLNRPRSERTVHRALRLTMARVHLWRQEWRAAANLIEPPREEPLWKDNVAMFRSAAIAAKIRLEIGRRKSTGEIAEWVAQLSTLNASLRMMGAQDYETFSLYLGYVYTGDVDKARALIVHYVGSERRDKTPISPEITEELASLTATTATLAVASELPGCVEAIDAESI